MSVRVRFAPSPTGLLHVGNVRTALFNWLFARGRGGQFLLRIEDTDAERSDRQFEEQLIHDLRWLFLDWDEGILKDGPCGPYRQKERQAVYQRYVRQMIDANLAYYCFCPPELLERDREGQQRSGQSIRYTGRCRQIPPENSARRVASGEPATVRLRVREGCVSFRDLVFGDIEVETSTIGDFILLRSDGSSQYNLACAVDDSLMRISHVIRGEGHISNTSRQLLLYEALGFEPPQFAHLSTILGPDGSKLSKRHGATSIKEFRDLGYLPDATINYLALLGWSPPNDGQEILSRNELIEQFSLDRVNVSPATFDQKKFNWVNRTHLRSQEPASLVDLALSTLVRTGVLPANPGPEMRKWAAEAFEVLVHYLDRLGDLPEHLRIITEFSPDRDLEADDVVEVLRDDQAVDVILAFGQALLAAAQDRVDIESYKQAVLSTQETTGQRGKKLFKPIRVAVTARASGPELEKLIPLIESAVDLDLPAPAVGVRKRVEEVCARLRKAGEDPELRG